MAPKLRSPDNQLRPTRVHRNWDQKTVTLDVTTLNIDRLEIKAGSWDSKNHTTVAVKDGLNAIVAKCSSANSSQSMTLLAFQGELQVGSQEINISPGFDPNSMLDDYHKSLAV